jgi:hypothetical protein
LAAINQTHGNHWSVPVREGGLAEISERNYLESNLRITCLFIAKLVETPSLRQWLKLPIWLKHAVWI